MTETTENTTLQNNNTPAIPIRDALITAIRAAGTGLPANQIRAAMDVSDVPRGPAALVVSCADLGGHNGMRTRILVDVRATITIATHLDEDQDGSLSDSIINAVIPVLYQFNPELQGWAIRHITPWETSEPFADGSFRQTSIVSTMFTQSI